MCRDVLQVFLVAAAGFLVCFRGLFPTVPEYSTIPFAMRTLFDALSGSHDLSSFDDNPLTTLGALLLVTFCVLSSIVLLNLLIAKLAVRIYITIIYSFITHMILLLGDVFSG